MKDEHAGHGGTYVMVDGKRVPQKQAPAPSNADPGDEHPAPQPQVQTRPAGRLTTR